MELPADFPHTRREQYLVALPVALLTGAELAEAMQVIGRVRGYLDEQIVRLLLLVGEGR